MVEPVYLMAFVWGVAIAVFVQTTRVGKYICLYMGWLMFCVAVIGDLLLLRLMMDANERVAMEEVWVVCSLTAVALIARGVYRQFTQNEEQMHVAKIPFAEQDDVESPTYYE